MLNLFVVCFCLFITDSFLDGQFHNMGWEWLKAIMNEDEVIVLGVKNLLCLEEFE